MLKTILIIVIILISILVLLFGVFFYVTLKNNNPHICNLKKHDTSIYKGKVEYHIDSLYPYLVKAKDDGSISDDPFKIMVVADMHNRTDDSDFTLTILSRFVELEKPDLVIMLGDNFSSREDTYIQDKLINFFESRKLYYGFVLGNHDSEAKASNEIRRLEKERELSNSEKEEIFKKARKWAFDTTANSKYCINYDASSESLHGSGNSLVLIKDSSGIREALYFFDSGDYILSKTRKSIGTERRCYDCIRESQLSWYKDSLNKIKSLNNNKLPKSIAYFHIPLSEFQTAWDNVKLNNKKSKLIFGSNFESCSSSDVDDGIFDTFKNSLSTELLMVGHDHKNDSLIEHEGIKLWFSNGLQYDGAYNRRKRAPFKFRLLNKIGGKYSIYNEGVSVIQVKKNGELDCYNRYAAKENFYKGLDKYFDKAFFKNFNNNSKGLTYVHSEIINYISKDKLKSIDLKENKIIKFNSLNINSYLYDYKDFGYLYISESKTLFNKIEHITLSFTPLKKCVPMLLINSTYKKNFNNACIEFYDLSNKEYIHPDYNKLKLKYDDIENYKDVYHLNNYKRTNYSLIKGGYNTQKSLIDTMIINAVKTYILICDEELVKKNDINKINEFKNELIKYQSNAKIKYLLNNIIIKTE